MLVASFIFVALISFNAALNEPANVPEYIPCENGCYYWGEKCYKVGGRQIHESLSWSKAVERCKSYRGNLVSIESQEEQDFIVTFLQMDLKDWIWIGLNDREKDGDYKWSDGTVFSYTNWKPGEPSNRGYGSKEDCVHLWFEPENDLTGTWNDRDCNFPEQYICEMKPNPNKRSPNPVYCSSEAGSGWNWENSCYHVVMEKKSWQNAEKHCKNYYNGHLVSILDKLEDVFLNYILDNITEEFWIGIKIQERLQQKWTSGWYVSYDEFDKEMHFKEGACVARKKRNEWTTFRCTMKLSFICKVSKETPPVLKSPPSGSHCPIEFYGWRDLGGENCYYFGTEKTLNYYKALFDCKRKGGNLVSLHSKEESDMILPFVKYNRLGRSFYIGLFRLFPREDEFAWTDGSAVNYVNWRPGQPDNEEEECVEVHTYQSEYLYRWNDISCASERGYICSVKKILPNSDLEKEDDCKSYASLNFLIGVFVFSFMMIIFLGIVAYYFRICGTGHRENATATFTAFRSPSTKPTAKESTAELLI